MRNDSCGSHLLQFQITTIYYCYPSFFFFFLINVPFHTSLINYFLKKRNQSNSASDEACLFYICMADFPKNFLKHVHTIIKSRLSSQLSQATTDTWDTMKRIKNREEAISNVYRECFGHRRFNLFIFVRQVLPLSARD